MKGLCVALLLLFLPGAALAAAAEEASYDALLAELKSGNTMIDFQAFRYARARVPGYNPYAALADPEKGDLIRAMADNSLEQVSAIARQIIERDYTDIDAHSALGAVLERRGQRQEAAFERTVAEGLLGSIQQSGDGMTPETAFVVIGVAEEYSLLGESGVQVVKQTLLQSDNGPVDALEVVDPMSGARNMVYFDVSRMFDAMLRLGGAPRAP